MESVVSNVDESKYSSDRHEFWYGTLGVNYLTADKQERYKMKLDYARPSLPSEVGPQRKDYMLTTDGKVSLANLNTLAQTPHTNWGIQKEEKKMFCNDDFDECCNPRTPEQEKATFLSYELRQAYRKIDSDLRKTFKMDEPEGPSTLAEMLTAMKDGKYTIDQAYLNEDGTIRKDATFYTWNFSNYLSWRTPENQADAKGYAEAEKKLDAANKDTERTIAIATPAEGLEALKAFEANTYN